MRRALILALLVAGCEDDILGGQDATVLNPDATIVNLVDTGAADAHEAGPPPLEDDAGVIIDASAGLDALVSIDATTIADDAAAMPNDDASAPSDAGLASTCDGGGASSSRNTSNSSEQFSGSGPPSVIGELVITSTGGQELRLPVPTDAGGTWVIDAPLFCGAQTLLATFPGVICPETITVFRSGCRTPDIQITLSWDAIGLDFELHLIRPGGRINDNASDCTWTSCISSSPDWGVSGDPTDNPTKDVDNTGTFGPENIYLSFPEAGLYTVMVEHWGGGGPDADGEVGILLAGAPQVLVPITNLQSRFAQAIATIDWATKTITPLTMTYDCNANWSGGCRDPIP